MAKILVIFYSRTGATKKVAKTIADLLQCDIEEIFDIKDRGGAMGYLMAGRDATLKNLTTIKETVEDPSLYDLTIIGTPVWAFTMATPIRTYIVGNKEKLKKVAFFCTEGGSGGRRAFREMETLCGQKPIAMLELLTKEVARNECAGKLKNFVNEIIKTFQCS